MTDSKIHRTIEAVWRIEAPKLIAVLTRLVHDVGLAEDLSQDALVLALQQWPEEGIPRNPAAWLMGTAQHRAIDRLRREQVAERKYEEIARQLEDPQDTHLAGVVAEDIEDDLLRLIFIACHPVLSPEARVALTLRLLGGLTVEEIGRAFLTPPTTIAQRIVRAKRTLAEAHIPFEMPAENARAARLASVLEVIYLIFNEGYTATAGDQWMRPTLCEEALRLGRILAELAKQEAEVHGLVALMEIQASRLRARVGPKGEPILLLDQNRARWDHLLIQRGLAALARAEQLGKGLGPYGLQAAIAACHARARTPEATDAELRFLQRCGVRHKAATFPFHPDVGWKLDELIQERERHEAFGLTLDMSSLPIYEQFPNIIQYGKSPERNREIGLVCEMIRTAARAGIDSLRYNTCVLPIDRTAPEEGPGGYFHTAFRLEQIPAEQQAALTDAGRVTAEMHWERIAYLLERMIPVAEEYKVRMGNSQEDPATPPGYRGVDKVLNDFEGMKRFIEIQRSPYHGWNFCVGSIAEMLENPAEEIFPFIEYFGSRNTIFLVHYRNIIGKRYSFREALPDEGDMDLYRVLKALKETGYCYGIDPDHVPRTADDPKGYYQSYAYSFGYINAMIQAVYGA